MICIRFKRFPLDAEAAAPDLDIQNIPMTQSSGDTAADPGPYIERRIDRNANQKSLTGRRRGDEPGF
jgi:hypothetical protein